MILLIVLVIILVLLALLSMFLVFETETYILLRPLIKHYSDYNRCLLTGYLPALDTPLIRGPE